MRRRRQGQRWCRQQRAEACEQRPPPHQLRHRFIKMRPAPIKHPPRLVISCALGWIGPQRLEHDLPPKLGDGPSATQNGDAFSQPACPLKNSFLLGVYHRS